MIGLAAKADFDTAETAKVAFEELYGAAYEKLSADPEAPVVALPDIWEHPRRAITDDERGVLHRRCNVLWVLYNTLAERAPCVLGVQRWRIARLIYIGECLIGTRPAADLQRMSALLEAERAETEAIAPLSEAAALAEYVHPGDAMLLRAYGKSTPNADWADAKWRDPELGREMRESARVMTLTLTKLRTDAPKAYYEGRATIMQWARIYGVLAGVVPAGEDAPGDAAPAGEDAPGDTAPVGGDAPGDTTPPRSGKAGVEIDLCSSGASPFVWERPGWDEARRDLGATSDEEPPPPRGVALTWAQMVRDLRLDASDSEEEEG